MQGASMKCKIFTTMAKKDERYDFQREIRLRALV
jgi:hypothetical protein